MRKGRNAILFPSKNITLSNNCYNYYYNYYNNYYSDCPAREMIGLGILRNKMMIFLSTRVETLAEKYKIYIGLHKTRTKTAVLM